MPQRLKGTQRQDFKNFNLMNLRAFVLAKQNITK